MSTQGDFVDSLQKQIMLANAKIDALYQLIEQLNQRLTEVLSETKLLSSSQAIAQGKGNGSHPMTSGYLNSDAVFKHKDVLSDDEQIDIGRQGGEKQLSPEIQIQRLTAQLTAAYNRIADLEERLLSQRITSLS